MSASAPIIFVSSTCHDLTDLRAELAASLQKDGFTVKLSDVLESAFQVIPSATTIGSCLQNLLASDAVLFIFDRFYGQCLGGEYGDKSATHVELEHVLPPWRGRVQSHQDSRVTAVSNSE